MALLDESVYTINGFVGFSVLIATPLFPADMWFLVISLFRDSENPYLAALVQADCDGAGLVVWGRQIPGTSKMKYPIPGIPQSTGGRH